MQIKMYRGFKEIMVLKLVIKLLAWVAGKEEKTRREAGTSHGSESFVLHVRAGKEWKWPGH